MSNEETDSEELRDLTGRVLGSEYRIDRRLGMGGMSHVYLAHQISVDRPVVVKVMIPPSVDVERWKGRFMREARAASKIRHGGVVTIYSFGEEEGVGPYIAMEFVEGRSLREVIEAEAPLEPYRAIGLVAQACRALHAAHDFGVVHRDLKPDNLMVEVEDGKERARVLDFGVAKAQDTLVETLDGHVVGTPAYMAPEQARDQEVDGRTDVYSMGIILFELLTGRRPFTAPTAVALMLKHVQEPLPTDLIDAPAEIVEVLERACGKDPGERWETAQAFAEALEELHVPRETPEGLQSVRTTDEAAMGPTTPVPTNQMPPVRGIDESSRSQINNPDSDPIDDSADTGVFESSPTRSAAELIPRGGERSARVALFVSLGSLLLAVVAVGFLVASLEGGDGTREADSAGETDEGAIIELLDSGSPDEVERTADIDVVARARVAVFESRTVARGASEKPERPDEPGDSELTPAAPAEAKTSDESSSSDTEDEGFQLLEPPEVNKNLVDPFEE